MCLKSMYTYLISVIQSRRLKLYLKYRAQDRKHNGVHFFVCVRNTLFNSTLELQFQLYALTFSIQKHHFVTKIILAYLQ